MVTSIKLSSYEVASNLRQFLIELLGGDALIQLSCFKDGMKLFELRESLRFRGTIIPKGLISLGEENESLGSSRNCFSTAFKIFPKKGGEKVPGARKIGSDNPK